MERRPDKRCCTLAPPAMWGLLLTSPSAQHQGARSVTFNIRGAHLTSRAAWSPSQAFESSRPCTPDGSVRNLGSRKPRASSRHLTKGPVTWHWSPPLLSLAPATSPKPPLPGWHWSALRQNQKQRQRQRHKQRLVTYCLCNAIQPACVNPQCGHSCCKKPMQIARCLDEGAQPFPATENGRGLVREDCIAYHSFRAASL